MDFPHNCELCATPVRTVGSVTKSYENAYEPALKMAHRLAKSLGSVGLQCVNTGMYGPMKLRPGECTCTRCEARKLLKEFEEQYGKEPA